MHPEAMAVWHLRAVSRARSPARGRLSARSNSSEAPEAVYSLRAPSRAGLHADPVRVGMRESVHLEEWANKPKSTCRHAAAGDLGLVAPPCAVATLDLRALCDQFATTLGRCQRLIGKQLRSRTFSSLACLHPRTQAGWRGRGASSFRRALSFLLIPYRDFQQKFRVPRENTRHPGAG